MGKPRIYDVTDDSDARESLIQTLQMMKIEERRSIIMVALAKRIIIDKHANVYVKTHSGGVIREDSIYVGNWVVLFPDGTTYESARFSDAADEMLTRAHADKMRGGDTQLIGEHMDSWCVPMYAPDEDGANYVQRFYEVRGKGGTADYKLMLLYRVLI